MASIYKQRVVVLISGSGSNLQAIIDASQSEDFPAQVVAVISNRPDVFGLQRAQQAGIPAQVIDHKQFGDRESFDAALLTMIDNHTPDLVVLAGFMRILTPDFVQHYLGRMINIHPSLLPKYPGLHTHRRALEAGDVEHGVTVHFVTAELDGGPAIVQARVEITQGDTEQALAQKVLAQEHIIYPLAIRWFGEQRLSLNNGKTCLDGEILSPEGKRV